MSSSGLQPASMSPHITSSGHLLKLCASRDQRLGDRPIPYLEPIMSLVFGRTSQSPEKADAPGMIRRDPKPRVSKSLDTSDIEGSRNWMNQSLPYPDNYVVSSKSNPPPFPTITGSPTGSPDRSPISPQKASRFFQSGRVLGKVVETPRKDDIFAASSTSPPRQRPFGPTYVRQVTRNPNDSTDIEGTSPGPAYVGQAEKGSVVHQVSRAQPKSFYSGEKLAHVHLHRQGGGSSAAIIDPSLFFDPLNRSVNFSSRPASREASPTPLQRRSSSVPAKDLRSQLLRSVSSSQMVLGRSLPRVASQKSVTLIHASAPTVALMPTEVPINYALSSASPQSYVPTHPIPGGSPQSRPLEYSRSFGSTDSAPRYSVVDLQDESMIRDLHASVKTEAAKRRHGLNCKPITPRTRTQSPITMSPLSESPQGKVFSHKKVLQDSGAASRPAPSGMRLNLPSISSVVSMDVPDESAVDSSSAGGWSIGGGSSWSVGVPSVMVMPATPRADMPAPIHVEATPRPTFDQDVQKEEKAKDLKQQARSLVDDSVFAPYQLNYTFKLKIKNLVKKKE